MISKSTSRGRTAFSLILICLALTLLIMVGLDGDRVIPAAGESHGNSKVPTTVLTTLNDLLADGRISAERFWLHHIQLLRAPERLPAELQTLERDRLPCWTGLVQQVQRRIETFSPAVRREIEELLAPRPPGRSAPDYIIDSTLYPLRVHYEKTSHEALAANVLGYLETSWTVEVEELGFFAPLEDRGMGGSTAFDVYVQNVPGGGSWVASLHENPDTPWYDVACYMVLDARIDDQPGPTASLMASYCAHEFNHACQGAYDWAGDASFYEITATFVEDLVYDDVDEYMSLVPDFQRFPEKALDYMDYYYWYEYGACLFFFFLSEHYDGGGAELVTRLWEESRQESRWVNEPDFFDAMELVIPDFGGETMEEAFLTFAEWRYFVAGNDDGLHFSEGALFPLEAEVAIMETVDYADLPVNDIAPMDPPSRWGSSYVQVNVGSATQGDKLGLDFQGDAAVAWAFQLLAIPDDGSPVAVTRIYADGAGHASATLGLTGMEKVIIVITNMGDGDYDPDQDAWEGFSFALDLDRVEAPPCGRLLTLTLHKTQSGNASERVRCGRAQARTGRSVLHT